MKFQGNYLFKILFSSSLSWHLRSHLSISSLSCSSICTSVIQVGLCSRLPDFGCRNLSVWSGHSKWRNFQSPNKRALPNSVRHSWTSHKISCTFPALTYQTTAGIFYSIWFSVLVACFVCLFVFFQGYVYCPGSHKYTKPEYVLWQWALGTAHAMKFSIQTNLWTLTPLNRRFSFQSGTSEDNPIITILFCSPERISCPHWLEVELYWSLSIFKRYSILYLFLKCFQSYSLSSKKRVFEVAIGVPGWSGWVAAATGKPAIC